MKSVNGKKFVFVFLALIVVFGAIMSVLMKQAYDSRPQIPIEEPKK